MFSPLWFSVRNKDVSSFFKFLCNVVLDKVVIGKVEYGWRSTTEVSAELTRISFSEKFESIRRERLTVFHLKIRYIVPEDTPKRIKESLMRTSARLQYKNIPLLSHPITTGSLNWNHEVGPFSNCRQGINCSFFVCVCVWRFDGGKMQKHYLQQ